MDSGVRNLLNKWRGRPVVAVFLSGDESLSRSMALQMRGLVRDHPHVIVGPPGVDTGAYAYAEEVIAADAARPLRCWLDLRRQLRGRRIALAPFLWTSGGPLRWMPWLLAPHKLLAFNDRLERHHLRLRRPIASWRFLRGDTGGDIFRPTLFSPLKKLAGLIGFPLLMACWAAERRKGRVATPPLGSSARILWEWSWEPRRFREARRAMTASRGLLSLLDAGIQVFEGRPAGRRLGVAVVTPYLPFPLSHGGAIRIFNLLRAAAGEADIHLFAFSERETRRQVEPLLEFCRRVVLVETPRWDPPSALLPPGVAKFRSLGMRAAVEAAVAGDGIGVVQVEYTQLAGFAAWLRRLPARTLLVEHDLTYDLYRQLGEHLNAWRWRFYEVGHARRFDRVVTMSEDDKQRLVEAGLAAARVAVVENGVDLERFQPAPASPSPPELLFVGSFRHFPNVRGFQFLLEKIWPLLRAGCPELKLTVVAGADHRYYWRRHTGAELAAPGGVEILDFVEDVRPLYRRATVVVVPLEVSAGTNLKVLEALAMGRPVVSTPVGIAGLGLTPGEHALVAGRADAFAAAVLGLLWNQRARENLALAGRALVEARYDWRALAEKQLRLWKDVSSGVE